MNNEKIIHDLTMLKLQQSGSGYSSEEEMLDEYFRIADKMTEYFSERQEVAKWQHCK